MKIHPRDRKKILFDLTLCYGKVKKTIFYFFAGASGTVHIDQVGDRASALQLQNVQKGRYKRTANFFVTTNYLQMLNTSTVIWPGKTTAVPIGRPDCGFNNEFCPPEAETGNACFRLLPQCWIWRVENIYEGE